MTDVMQTTPRAASAVRGWAPADEEALLTGMLERYSPSREERPLAEWLCDWLRGARLAGLRADVDEVGNLIAELPANVTGTDGTTPAPLVLLGHLDTVPGYIPPRREGDLLYGRGAVDAKGPLAAFLAAVARLATHGEPRARSVIVVGAVEEEAATSRGARAVLERWRPAAAIIGEPSGAAGVTLAYKGRLLARMRVAAPVSHTARPEDGVCARAVAVWSAIQRHAAGWNVEHGAASTFAALQPSLRALHSGSDGFSDWCELEVGYRLPPGFDAPGLVTWLEATAQAAEATLAIRGIEPAYQGERRGPLVSAYVRALRAEGLDPTFKRKTGTSDMNVVGPVWQCPIVAYGPGDAALDHTPGEHIALREYAQGIAVLERVLGEWVHPSRAADQRKESDQ
jgi:N-acetyl-ornithine/N-acetyl-lysine deacetylase